MFYQKIQFLKEPNRNFGYEELNKRETNEIANLGNRAYQKKLVY